MFDDAGERMPITPTTELGPTVITDDARGMKGRVLPIRWNPMECSTGATVTIRVWPGPLRTALMLLQGMTCCATV